MKTLRNHTILYDAECPMCRMYTKAFTQVGMLDERGAQPYQQMPETVCAFVDQKRAVNEIALVDHVTGQVSYGIHSLFKVLGTSIPVFAPLFAFRPFIWLMTEVYAFVSYNRKVIIPVGLDAQNKQLQPDFRVGYRLSYLLFSWFMASFILTKYAVLLTGLVPVGGHLREYFICAGQLFFQAAMIRFVARERTWEYLGNMMTISFAGALLLLPALTLSSFVQLPALVYAGYFLLVAGLMFLEHFRRMQLLQVGHLPTLSWLVYRLLILLLILFI
ncbi:DUF393 domain-containing protein [Pedobacter sp. GR22-6]|uniref:DUF393 domain-containing protein n=1 Tax=Pedobacter sp. GR22-6 TaxID=3127957 RepID=UPI00307CEA45